MAADTSNEEVTLGLMGDFQCLICRVDTDGCVSSTTFPCLSTACSSLSDVHRELAVSANEHPPCHLQSSATEDTSVFISYGREELSGLALSALPFYVRFECCKTIAATSHYFINI